MSSRREELQSGRLTVGRAKENDIARGEDATASHMHAVLERFASGWAVTDIGSSNGPWVDGERMWSARPLRDGDEIRIGQTRLLFRDQSASTRAIAEELVITQAAVKQHLAELYDKFGIADVEAQPRARPANAALRRGALTLTELHSAPGE